MEEVRDHNLFMKSDVTPMISSLYSENRSISSSIHNNVSSRRNSSFFHGISLRTVSQERCHHMLGPIGSCIQRFVSHVTFDESCFELGHECLMHPVF